MEDVIQAPRQISFNAFRKSAKTFLIDLASMSSEEAERRFNEIRDQANEAQLPESRDRNECLAVSAVLQITHNAYCLHKKQISVGK